jgi:hypothetical protein
MRDVAEQIRDHATWLETQLPPLDPSAFAPWHSDAWTPDDERDERDVLPTDPARGMGVVPVADASERPGRRVLWTAVAAMVAAAVLIAGVALSRSRAHVEPQPPTATTTTTSPTGLVATSPDSALQLQQIPTGWQVWTVGASRNPGKDGVVATFLLASQLRAPMTVTTCPGGSGGCTDPFASLVTKGTRNSDGSITHASRQTYTANGVSHTTGPIVNLERVWPDGAGVSITVSTGPLDVAVADALASSVRLADVAGLKQVEAEASDRLAALPLLASADLPNGRVELHGQGDLRAACVAPDLAGATAPLSCPLATFVSGGVEPTAPYVASLLYGNQWVVGAATANPGTLTFTPQTANLNQLPPPLDSHTTSVTRGGTTYQLGLVFVPASVDSIFSVVTGSAGNYGGGGTDRPTVDGLPTPPY